MTAQACYLTPKPTHDARAMPECPPPPGPAPSEHIDLDLDPRSFPWLIFPPHGALTLSPADPSVAESAGAKVPPAKRGRGVMPKLKLKPRPFKHARPSPPVPSDSRLSRPVSPDAPAKAGLGSLTRNASFQRTFDHDGSGRTRLLRCPSFSRLV